MPINFIPVMISLSKGVEVKVHCRSTEGNKIYQNCGPTFYIRIGVPGPHCEKNMRNHHDLVNFLKTFNQCCGSGTFCRIRIRIRNKSFRIRIRPIPNFSVKKVTFSQPNAQKIGIFTTHIYIYIYIYIYI
jgi:hypothetical protein